MKTYLSNLNENQLRAVETLDGNVLVHASAGSGKTRTLVARYMRLVDMLGVSTDSILCVTFTNKAANEMKARVRRILGDADLGYICTFHGLCVRILREDGSFFGYSRKFAIVDNEDVDLILSEIFRRFGITAKKMTHKKARQCIHSFRENNSEEYYRIMAATDLTYLNSRRQDKAVANYLEARVIYEYFYELKKNEGLDFEDLIYMGLHLLESSKEACAKWQKRFAYIMTDEYQDVSPAQVALLDILSRHHRRVFVVGDPDQTIYEFRGADVGYILNFADDFSPCTLVTMNTNYRSGKKILDAANSLIRRNEDRFDNEMVSAKDSPGYVGYYHAKTEKEEYDWISGKITELHEEYGVGFSDIAVLYRKGDLSRGVEESFRRSGNIPYVILSGVEFYMRKEIRDVLAYLRLCRKDDDLAFLRIVNTPRRNLGKQKIDHVKKYAAEHGISLFEALEATFEDEVFKRNGGTKAARAFIDLITRFRSRNGEALTGYVQDLLNESGYEPYLRESGDTDRLDNLASLKQSVKDFEDQEGEKVTLADYLDHMALYTDMDQDLRKNSVKLMTVHSAKGLEFPYVFICGMNEGIFPSAKSTTPKKLEEERRVAYVAFTRAEEALYLTDSEGRNYQGMFKYPSRFIFDAGGEDTINFLSELPEYLRSHSSRITSAAAAAQRNQKLKVGDKVEHECFGPGSIVEISRETIEVRFDNQTTNIRLAAYAPLRKIA